MYSGLGMVVPKQTMLAPQIEQQGWTENMQDNSLALSLFVYEKKFMHEKSLVWNGYHFPNSCSA